MFINVILRKFHSVKVVIVLIFLCNSILAPFHALHNPYRWISDCSSSQNGHLALFAIGGAERGGEGGVEGHGVTRGF